jgi:hypothetical protein
MTRKLILHPARDEIAKWGILAHVDVMERNRILNMSFGQFQKEKKILTKEVDLAKFSKRKKSNVTESWYNPNRTKFNKEPNHESDITPDETEHL